MLHFTVLLPLYILCTYYRNYNYWVIITTNPEPPPNPCTYLILPSTFLVSTCKYWTEKKKEALP